jgi:hypothetical protein
MELVHGADIASKGVSDVRLETPENPPIKNKHSIDRINSTYYPIDAVFISGIQYSYVLMHYPGSGKQRTLSKFY